MDRRLIILEDYKEFVNFRRKQMPSQILDLLHGAVGVSGEAGELLDCIKKSWVYNKPIDEANIIEECGDTLFYIQMICNNLGVDLTFLLEQNVLKLRKRYPDGYSDAAAQTRADKVKPLGQPFSDIDRNQ